MTSVLAERAREDGARSMRAVEAIPFAPLAYRTALIGNSEKKSYSCIGSGDETHWRVGE
jgi:hypothetical protein